MFKTITSVTIALLTFGLAACTDSTVGQTKVVETAQIKTVEDYPAIFQPLLPTLQTQININNLVLPTYIPESDNPLLQALLTKSSRNGYEIMLAYDKRCKGGTACRMGSISAQQLRDEYPPLEGQKVVILNDNTEAFFIDATCGANCSDSTLTWIDDNAVRHQIGIQAGKLEILVKMANSAITN